MSADVLSDRALNRATLARQMLLKRVEVAPLDAVRDLVGLQAQAPQDPYVALWSRIRDFEPTALEQLLLDRAVVRVVVMRGTVHLVTADDCLGLRKLFQAVLDAELERHSEHGASLRGADVRPVLDLIRPFLAEAPRTQAEIRARITEALPALDAPAMAYACRNHVALVQVPPRGLWTRSGQVRSTTAETWLGRPLVENPSLDAAVLRYFAAFGPASVADVTTWSRLTGLRAVIERLRPQLRSFRDERGRELWDLPDAPRPPADVPAPTRFLPEYDNVLLSHADRTRFLQPDDARRRWASPVLVRGSVLHDGLLTASWYLDGTAKRDTARTLVVNHPPGTPKRVLSAIAAEGRRLLPFVAKGAPVDDVRLVAS